MFKSYLDMAIEFFKIDANVFEIGGYGNEVVYGSLSWSVDNAMLVQVSGLGAVDPKESGVRVPINQNETFVLTAIDPITGKILTASQSVTVEPSVPSRWIPSGTILMWSGSVVPPGFRLCDGTNGTPDLRNRFIAGAIALWSDGDQHRAAPA